MSVSSGNIHIILQENQSGQDFNLSIYEKEGIYGN
ncbi:Uncharacterised protein [Streptococcus constellatus]|uniref:Uncharacterized protein n=1 Tax=Streptococcus constellatus TaxID=76860 RepID=A0A564SCD0_STRCV|nr:Uncharacterised protein [Streptococcus constellatus]VUX12091.1 Uncharacterised protein [Streptococcus gordonii]